MRWLVLFPLIGIACQSKSVPQPIGPDRQTVEVPAATETEPDPSASSTSAPSRTPAPDPTSASRCDNAIANLKAEVASAPGDCKADSDCACYVGGPEPAHCGGVASRAIADRITELVRQIQREKCQAPSVACAAWSCVPRCDKGRCSR